MGELDPGPRQRPCWCTLAESPTGTLSTVGGPLSYGTSAAWPRMGRRVLPSFGRIGWPWSLCRGPYLWIESHM